jgi:hypothetical protein
VIEDVFKLRIAITKDGIEITELDAVAGSGKDFESAKK